MSKQKQTPLQAQIEEFAKQMLASGSIYKSSFSKICDGGFGREALGGLLFGVCWAATNPKVGNRRLSNLTEFSNKQLDRLQSDLSDLANTLDRIAEPIWVQGWDVANIRRYGTRSNSWHLVFLDSDKRQHECVRAKNRREAIRLLKKRLSEQGSRYSMLPNVLRGFSLHLTRYRKRKRAFGKRRTIVHLMLFNLMTCLNAKTRRLFFEELSTLLTRGFVIFGGSESQIPRSFSAESLAKLWQRILIDNRSMSAY